MTEEEKGKTKRQETGPQEDPEVYGDCFADSSL